MKCEVIRVEVTGGALLKRPPGMRDTKRYLKLRPAPLGFRPTAHTSTTKRNGCPKDVRGGSLPHRAGALASFIRPRLMYVARVA